MLSTHHARRLTFSLRARLQWPSRPLSAAPIREYTEQVTVPCKGNGSITLDINYPPSTSSTIAQPSDTPAVLIKLPSGIYTPASLKTADLSSAQLAAATGLPVIHLNYRLSPSHRFPTPVHDITHGYDWIVNNFLPSPLDHIVSGASNNSSEDLPETAQQSRIGIYGTHIGGSLALSLALTECRTPSSLSSLYDHPARIVAVATTDAITDWPLLAPLKVDTQVAPLFAGRNDLGDQVPSNEELEGLRRSFFQDKRPGDYFDPFASPALFFRTAGVELPAKNVLSYLSSRSASGSSSASSSNSRSGSEHDTTPLLTPPTSLSQSSGSVDLDYQNRIEDQNLKPPRFYARRFPPTSMGPTILPTMRLSATANSIFELQAIEFVKLVQRAMVRQIVPSGVGQRLVDEILEGEEAAEAKSERNELLKDARELAHDRAEHVVRDEGQDMEEEAERVGKWFRRTV